MNHQGMKGREMEDWDCRSSTGVSTFGLLAFFLPYNIKRCLADLDGGVVTERVQAVPLVIKSQGNNGRWATHSQQGGDEAGEVLLQAACNASLAKGKGERGKMQGKAS